jgi:hypothetical protein
MGYPRGRHFLAITACFPVIIGACASIMSSNNPYGPGPDVPFSSKCAPISIPVNYELQFNQNVLAYSSRLTDSRARDFLSIGARAFEREYYAANWTYRVDRTQIGDGAVAADALSGWSRPLFAQQASGRTAQLIRVDPDFDRVYDYRWKISARVRTRVDDYRPRVIRFDGTLIVDVERKSHPADPKHFYCLERVSPSQARQVSRAFSDLIFQAYLAYFRSLGIEVTASPGD